MWNHASLSMHYIATIHMLGNTVYGFLIHSVERDPFLSSVETIALLLKYQKVFWNFEFSTLT